MFTGIIETIGAITARRQEANSISFNCRAPGILKDVRNGDSIAVNGTCQTVVTHDTEEFSFQTMSDTLEKTSLGELRVGAKVNLERALQLQSRVGGHLVSGHIDVIAVVEQIESHREPHFLRIRFKQEMSNLIIPQGSIAIDGISLTIQEIQWPSVRVGLIRHTLETTILKYRQKGEQVNVEFDILGKYVQAHLELLHKDKSNQQLLGKLKQFGFV